MHRLLQGDVGSGKTIVALLAAVVAMENGLQAAMLAPTEILAKQHYATLARQLASTRFTVDLLTGSTSWHRPSHYPGAPRAGVDAPGRGHARARAGDREVPPARPGRDRRAAPVRRRAGAAMREKGLRPDVLLMTATPISADALAHRLQRELDVLEDRRHAARASADSHLGEARVPARRNLPADSPRDWPRGGRPM